MRSIPYLLYTADVPETEGAFEVTNYSQHSLYRTLLNSINSAVAFTYDTRHLDEMMEKLNHYMYVVLFYRKIKSLNLILVCFIGNVQ